ncbi:hypothetical protein VQ042_19555 [Aurantimonas sp. A2-1-M11]|uniref:hypothetical protein n=1 Tax=Aurantimonas sp. A2-1-M11 TaxID=3113712 RepID=UPI002F94820B
MARIVTMIGRNGRWMLLAGLAGGLLFPELASLMRAALFPLIAAILFVSVLRVEPAQIARALTHMRRDLPLVLLLQFLLPLAVAALFFVCGISGPLAGVIILTTAAAPITGGAGLAALTGLDSMTALRLLVWGTILLPLTSILPLQIVFPGEAISPLEPALRLLGVIALAGGLALLVRLFWQPGPQGEAMVMLDAASALLLAALVLGLMDAIQPMLLRDPWQVLLLLAAAFGLNFGLQIATNTILRRSGSDPRIGGAVALMAGNRNLALFLVALPLSSMEAMMVFVGCYQIPMFLTPLLMRSYYGLRDGAI